MADLAPGINFDDMHPAMWHARSVVDRVTREFVDRNAVITSGRREAVGAFSWHHVGRALDLRVRDMTAAQQRDYARRLREELGPDFEVILEGPHAPDPRYRDRPPHVHVEWDPRAFYAQAED